MRRGVVIVLAVAAACVLGACSGPQEPGPLHPSDIARPQQWPLDSRVAPLVLTAAELGVTGDWPDYLTTKAAVPDCGVEPVTSGGAVGMIDDNMSMEKVYLFATRAQARSFYERVVEGRCDGYTLPRKQVALPSLGDASVGYRYERTGDRPDGGHLGAWILKGRSVLVVVSDGDQAELKRLAAAADKSAQRA